MKLTKKISALLALAITVNGMALINPTSASAAKKVSLSTKKVNITVGKTKKLKLKNTKKKVTWSIASGKKCITLKAKKRTSVIIKAKKDGKAKVQAKVGKKKYKCIVIVKKDTKQSSNNNASEEKNVAKNIEYAVPYQASNMSEYNANGTLKEPLSVLGNTYYYGLRANWTCNTATANYNLNGQYKKFNFSIGHVDNQSSEDNMTIKIYNDGVLIKTFEPSYFVRNIYPERFSIDVTNIKILTIEIVSGSDYNKDDYALLDCTINKLNDSKDLSSVSLKSLHAKTNKSDQFYAVPYQTSNMSEYNTDGTLKEPLSVLGNTYYYGLRANWTCNTATADYNLNGEYKKFNFSIGHVDNQSSEDNMTIKIYNDGVLVKTFDASYFNADMLLQYTSIDVTNIKIMTVEVVSGSDYNKDDYAMLECILEK